METWSESTADLGRPLALLADIHANLEALEAVLDFLDAEGIHQAWVLGDLVGYGASPVEVVDRIKERGWPMIRGNHEDMLLSFAHADDRGVLKKRARKAVEWTRERLGPRQCKRLGCLPSAARNNDLWAVHGSLVDPSHCYAYLYDLSLDLNIRALRHRNPSSGTVVAHGHTHTPKIFRVSGHDGFDHPLPRDEEGIELSTEEEWLINPGSVGYPRDGDVRASLMIWHGHKRRLRYVRLSYDVESAAERIRRAGYAPEIAERLLEAR